jgi:dTDP-glucose 4,6-dehydratase
MRPYDGRVVPAFIIQALKGEPLTVFGKGKQTRSFCYVSDLVEGLIRLMNSNGPGPINIGNPDEMTILEFAHLVISLTDSNSDITYEPLPIDDPKVRQPDINKAESVLNWVPKVNINTGLSRTIDFFRETIK